MKILRDANSMRQWSFAKHAQGRSIGLVPTMGAIHEGHASLLRACVAQNDANVFSIFVNPAQFAPHEDFDQYPRTFEADLALAEAIGIDALYAPTAMAMYPKDYATYVDVERVSDGLCALTRPHFFRGVATVVAKLFNAVLPDRAYFGQKDAQQCAVIRRMARDLDMEIDIVEMPIIREHDGLAMSSRNQYLNAEERQRALSLFRALRAGQHLLECGERQAEVITKSVVAELSNVDIDYVAFVDAESIQPISHADRPVLLAVAANLGKARLIDNIKFSPKPPVASKGVHQNKDEEDHNVTEHA